MSDNHAAGHVCGDSMDMVNGRPTGSIRVSFGYFSLKADADKVLDIIRRNYIERLEGGKSSKLDCYEKLFTKTY